MPVVRTNDSLHACSDLTAGATLQWLLAMQMLGAARGMLYLHDSRPPVIHRDLKSPNLLVDRAGQVKVSVLHSLS
jgi:serine/threonine protein kinase